MRTFLSHGRADIESALRWAPTLLTLACIGCNESLPPRVDPEDVLSTSVFMENGQFYAWYQYDPASQKDSLVYVDEPNISVFLRNNYNEVLQGPVEVHGTVEIWDMDRPGHRAVLDLRRSFISPSPADSILTLYPGQRALLGTYWDQLVAGPIPIPVWTDVSGKEHKEYDARLKDSVTYFDTDNIHLGVKAMAALFAQTGTTTSPVFDCWVSYHIREAR